MLVEPAPVPEPAVLVFVPPVPEVSVPLDPRRLLPRLWPVVDPVVPDVSVCDPIVPPVPV